MKRDGRARRVIMMTVACLVAADVFAGKTETSGDILRVVIPAAAYGVAWNRKDDAGKRQFIKSFAGTVATTYVLKKVIDKERPNGDDEAFPSGHAATSFAGAAFLHRRYGWRDAWPAYLLSAYVGWTRVDADEHETEDVVAGAAVALGWNWWLVRPANQAIVTPVASSDMLGLTWQVRW